MAEQWNVGDVVQLKSGGPIMTVTNSGTYGGKPGVDCSWFDGKKPTSHVFPSEAVQRYVEPKFGDE